MKTSNAVIHNTKSAFHNMKIAMALIILASSLLFMASCKKEESGQPSSSGTSGQNERRMNYAQASQRLVFRTIIIDHRAANTDYPEYTLKVNNNGSALYTGIKNVKTIGTVKLEMSARTINLINDFAIKFIESTKYLKMESTINESKTMAIPMVLTTFANNNGAPSVTLRDNNSGQPVWLATFRNEVEKALDISSLTKGNGIPDDSEIK